MIINSEGFVDAMSKGLYDLTGYGKGDLHNPKYKFRISDIIPMTSQFFDDLPELIHLQFDPQMINRYFQLYEKDIDSDFILKRIFFLKRKKTLHLKKLQSEVKD